MSSTPSLSRFHTGLRRVLTSRALAVMTTPHGVDRYLELFNPTWSVNEVRAEVLEVRHPTADAVTLRLRPNGNWQGFRAGQFVRLTVEIDGVHRSRCYSPANAAHGRDEIELTAKAHAGGFVSKHLKQNMQAGMVVTLSQADGVFALPQARPDRMLLVSGGSGITPVMSMLRTLCAEGHAGKISFLHYCRSAADLIYAAELAEIAAAHPNVEVLRCYELPEQCGELHGRFSREQLASAVPDYREAATFLCGPGGLMQAVQQVWETDGIGERLHLERFTAAPAVPVNSGGAEGEVRFARSERLAVNNGASLLDQAEGAGLKPESGCRMGICQACKCTKLAGLVRDTRNGRLSEGGEEEIQLCVSVPVGTVTLDL